MFKQNLLKNLAYELGLSWRSPAPRTVNDKFLNKKSNVLIPGQIELNGQLLDKRTLQILAGCPGGGEVEVAIFNSVIKLSSRHASLIKSKYNVNIVEIKKTGQGNILYLDYIWFADSCPKGLGVVALLRMAQMAQFLGFVRIELLAAGGTGVKSGNWSEPYWGYATWPQFGFDCLLQPEILDLTKHIPELARCTKVSELVAIQPEWWKTHGDGWEMAFDLRPGSQSWHTLLAYIRKKGFES